MTIHHKNERDWPAIIFFGCTGTFFLCACCWMIMGLGTLVYTGVRVANSPPRHPTAVPTDIVRATSIPTITPTSIFALRTRTAVFESLEATQIARTETAIAHAPTLQAVSERVEEIIINPDDYLIDDLTTNLLPQFGPESGKLIVHEIVPPNYGSPLVFKNFIARVRFINPDLANWNYSIFLRKSLGDCQFLFRSNQRWEFDCRGNVSASGVFEGIDGARGGRNLLEVVAQDSTLVIYINKMYLDTVNISLQYKAGSIMLQAGDSNGDMPDNKDYPFSDFTVWELP